MKDEMINLKCPSCGSPMEAPNQQGVSECPSCHTKIIVPQSETSKENKNVSRYQELCKVAKEARNGADLLKYANEILEIDPKNVDGWINKAIATSWKTTAINDFFDEAYDYLKQAREIDPDNESITETENGFRKTQFIWYIHLAQESTKKADEVILFYDPSKSNWLIKAMDYYVKALHVKPDDDSLSGMEASALEMMKRIYNIGVTRLNIRWGSDAQAIIIKLNQSEQKAREQQAIAEQLKQLNEKLKQRQAELAKLKQKKGLFANWDIEDAQKEISKVSAEIERLEKIARGNV